MPSQEEPFLKELGRIRQEVNRLFEEALLGDALETAADAPPGMWAPAVDVVEVAEAYLFYAELPGVARSDIEIDVGGQRVEISGQRKPLVGGRSFLRMESRYGPFRWSFDLASPVDGEAMEASLERGVLKLVLPKAKVDGGA